MKTLRRMGLLVLCSLVAHCDETPEPPLLTTKNPFDQPVNLLEGRDVEGCAIYQTLECETQVLRRCSVYDADDGQFVTPDPLTHRALLWERWYDLYHSPDGQTAKRGFRGDTPADMTEEEWSSLDHFDEHNGMGDSAIWTGTALNGYILRYLVTGTEVDYQRMEDKVRDLLTMFDATEIPGYLARYHYLYLPTGAPRTDAHVLGYEGLSMNHTHHRIVSPHTVDNLPDVYTTGVRGNDGSLWKGTPMWNGTPTIDQYSGITTSLPAAWGLLRDPALKKKIAWHITCYLKRLHRIEVTHIQANEEASNVIAAFLEDSNSQLDPGDIDFSTMDRMVMYVLQQPNSMNVDTFDRSCPDEIAMTAGREIDARSPTFESELLELVFDAGGKKDERKDGFDHYYVPSARGADAVHLMHLAAMAYHFTGDEMYRDFLETELVANIRTIDVAHTLSAVIPPKWCRKWYASHISIPPVWAFINLLEPSELRTQMQRVFHEEAWVKDGARLGNAKFALMFAGIVPPEVATGQEEAAAEGLARLRELGGNGGDMDGPRRSYSVDYDTVVSQLPPGVTAECPSEETVQLCEKGPELFGVTLDGWDITKECTGAANECPTANGQCAEKRASAPLPVPLREWWGFQWQGDPFRLSVSRNIEGRIQSSGVDLFEPYWIARYYGFIEEAKGQVLAWREVGSCP